MPPDRRVAFDELGNVVGRSSAEARSRVSELVDRGAVRSHGPGGEIATQLRDRRVIVEFPTFGVVRLHRCAPRWRPGHEKRHRVWLNCLPLPNPNAVDGATRYSRAPPLRMASPRPNLVDLGEYAGATAEARPGPGM
jgi:hypothetical protein